LLQDVTEQFKLEIGCVETKYDSAVHITDKHCVLILIMTGQCTLQIECWRIAFSLFFCQLHILIYRKISNDDCTNWKRVSFIIWMF